MKPCEEMNPYDKAPTNAEFLQAQAKQRECFAVATGFDWSKVDISGIEKMLGIVTNPWPDTYNFPPPQEPIGFQSTPMESPSTLKEASITVTRKSLLNHWFLYGQSIWRHK